MSSTGVSGKIVPKKFYRYILKGVQYFNTRDARGCTLKDLEAYVYLKNQRAYNLLTVETMVKNATALLGSKGLLKRTTEERYILNRIICNDSFNSNDPIESSTDSLAIAEPSFSTSPQKYSENDSSSIEHENLESSASPSTSTSGDSTKQRRVSSNPDKDEKFHVGPEKSKSDQDMSSSSTEDPPSKRFMQRKETPIPLPKHRRVKEPDQGSLVHFDRMPDLIPLQMDLDSVAGEEATPAHAGYNLSVTMPELMPLGQNAAHLKFESDEEDSD